MKNGFALLVVAFLFISFSACRRCYQCHNQCEVCRKQRPDTTLTITVCSDVLSKDFYNLYLDSLTSPSVGWVCADTTSTVQKKVCNPQLESQSDIFTEEQAGFVCSPQ